MLRAVRFAVILICLGQKGFADTYLSPQVTLYPDDFRTQEIAGIAYSPGGGLLAAGSFNGRAVIWDAVTRRRVSAGTLPGAILFPVYWNKQKAITFAQFDQGSRRLTSLIALDPSTGGMSRLDSDSVSNSLSKIGAYPLWCSSGMGHLAVFDSASSAFCIIDLETLSTRHFKLPSGLLPSGAAMSPLGSCIAIRSGRDVFLARLDAGKTVALSGLVGLDILNLNFDASGSRLGILASHSKTPQNGELLLFNLATEELVHHRLPLQVNASELRFLRFPSRPRGAILLGWASGFLTFDQSDNVYGPCVQLGSYANEMLYGDGEVAILQRHRVRIFAVRGGMEILQTGAPDTYDESESLSQLLLCPGRDTIVMAGPKRLDFYDIRNQRLSTRFHERQLRTVALQRSRGLESLAMVARGNAGSELQLLRTDLRLQEVMKPMKLLSQANQHLVVASAACFEFLPQNDKDPALVYWLKSGKTSVIECRERLPVSIKYCKIGELYFILERSGQVVSVYSLEGKMIRSLELPSKAVAMACHPALPLLTIGYENGSLEVIETELPHRTLVTRKINVGKLDKLDISHDGFLLAISGSTSDLTVVEAAGLEPVCILKGQLEGAATLALCCPSKKIVSYSFDGKIRMWQLGAMEVGKSESGQFMELLGAEKLTDASISLILRDRKRFFDWVRCKYAPSLIITKEQLVSKVKDLESSQFSQRDAATAYLVSYCLNAATLGAESGSDLSLGLESRRRLSRIDQEYRAAFLRERGRVYSRVVWLLDAMEQEEATSLLELLRMSRPHSLLSVLAEDALARRAAW